MATVVDPRSPRTLIPVLLFDWINIALSVAVSLYMVVSDTKRVIFGIIGSVARVCARLPPSMWFTVGVCAPVGGGGRLSLQGFLTLIGVRNILFLITHFSQPEDEELEVEMQGASHWFLTTTFGWTGTLTLSPSLLECFCVCMSE